MAGPGNGRTYDPEIADVVLQAILDGHRTYREAIDVVHAQAPLRAAEVKDAGGTKAEVDAERRRWSKMNKCSFTRWKRDNPEFERELMAAEDFAAREQIQDVLDLGHECVTIADDESLEQKERFIRIVGRGKKINVMMWAIGARLTPRKTFHDSTPASPEMVWPVLPANTRLDLVVAPPGRADGRPN